MAVLCLSEQQKNDLYESWCLDQDKKELAKRYGVSVRTVGRVIDEVAKILSKPSVPVYNLTEEEADELFDPTNVEVEEKAEYFVVAARDSISITKVLNDGKIESCSAVRGDDVFEEASTIIWGAKASQESLEKAYELIHRPAFIEKYSQGNLTVDPEANRVYFVDNGIEYDFNGRLVPRLLDSLSDGPDSETFKGLINFAQRLINNPSFRTVNELYDFLEASDIEITEQGLVRCFKKVRSNYMDIHSNSFDNTPGKVLSINRNMADEDSDVTCSHGLHVCSKSYLPCFGSSSEDRVLSVLVDPADFVAIPKDYNNAKARVCSYFSEKDVTDTLTY